MQAVKRSIIKIIPILWLTAVAGRDLLIFKNPKGEAQNLILYDILGN
jgi:hypothetical protein